MTRQMADDEVLRPEVVAWQNRFKFENGQWSGWAQSLSAKGMTTLVQHYADKGIEAEGRELITIDSHNAAVAALQAERDALRGKLAGETARAAALEALAEQSAAKHNEACEWAERDRAALEALRGQVAELMKFREGGLPTKGWLRDNDQSRRVLHELNELLAMKNSGEF